MKVVCATRLPFRDFRLEPAETMGKAVYRVGYREWDIPEWQRLFEMVLPRDPVFVDFATERAFRGVDARRSIRTDLGEGEIP